jgi:hypothetical protein
MNREYVSQLTYHGLLDVLQLTNGLIVKKVIGDFDPISN